MSTKMINFRLTEAEVDRLDQLARIAGMNRSDYIKSCLARALSSGVKPAKKPERQGPQCPAGNPRTCENASWVKLVTGVSLCQTCGVKRA